MAFWELLESVFLHNLIKIIEADFEKIESLCLFTHYGATTLKFLNSKIYFKKSGIMIVKNIY